MITKDDITSLREVFRAAMMYAGCVEEPTMLATLIAYKKDLENRMNKTLETLNKKPKNNGKNRKPSN